MNEAKRRAKKKYKEKIEELRIELYPTDTDIKTHLAAQNEPKATYVKRVIREDIKRTKIRQRATEGIKIDNKKRDTHY